MFIEKIGKAPRPNLFREKWVSLNGQWEFDFDDHNLGIEGKWYEGAHHFSSSINVPFCFQSKKSGINNQDKHEIVWYRNKVMVPVMNENENLWINFGAVDYKTTVWIDGIQIKEHQGGSTSFSLKVPKHCAVNGSFVIVLRVEDKYSCEQPRGKQYWGTQPERCWYTPTTGIWQNVWMEIAGAVRIDKVLITPDVDNHFAYIETKLSGNLDNGKLSWKLYYNEKLVKTGEHQISEESSKFGISIDDEDPIDTKAHLWSPENPNLYFLTMELTHNHQLYDQITTYFGMRKIEVYNGKIRLNNFPLYQKLILDQGYWEESLMTPPDDEALLRDVVLTLKMGFNGVRKHQKIEDPRFFFYADVHGLLVWNEMPSTYQFSNDSMFSIMNEWKEVLENTYNHPSIITLVPLNESWGVKDILHNEKQQNFAVSLYHLTKAIDSTRLVSTNDGWEAVTADLCGIHDYEKSGENLLARYKDRDKLLAWTAVGKMLYADGFTYGNQPVLISEFGGIAIQDDNRESWGYNDKVSSGEELIDRVDELVSAIQKLDYVQGYCYTQLTDVEQETNGLLYSDRTPKVDIDRIRKVIEMKGLHE